MKIIKTIKYLIYLFIALFLVLGIALSIGLYYLSKVDLNQMKGKIELLISEATQRDFKIDGDIVLSRSLIPTLTVDSISLAGMPGGKYKEMFSAEKIELSIAIVPLFKKQVAIKEVIAIEPQIFLEKNVHGKSNWTLGNKTAIEEKTKQSNGSNDAIFNFSLERLNIKAAKLHYTDDQTEKSYALFLPTLSLASKTPKSPITLEAALEVLINKSEPLVVGLKGTLPSLNALMDGKSLEFALSMYTRNSDISVNGHINDLKNKKGIDITSAIKINSLDEIAQLLEAELPHVVPININLNLKSKSDNSAAIETTGNINDIKFSANGMVTNFEAPYFSINTKMELAALQELEDITGSSLPNLASIFLEATLSSKDKNIYKISNVSLKSDKADFSGEATVQLPASETAIPIIDASFKSNIIDLRELISESSKKEQVQAQEMDTTKQKQEKIFSSDPLPFDLLRQVDAKLTLFVGKLLTKAVALEKISLNASTKDGELLVEPLQFSFADEEAKVLLRANLNGKTSVLSTNLEVSDLTLQKILPKRKIGEVTGGNLNLTSSHKTSGDSIAQLMANLSGKTTVSLGKTTLQIPQESKSTFSKLTSEIIEIFLPISTQQNVIECATAQLHFQQGKNINKQILGVKTDQLDITGSGVIDLAQETLKVSIKPKAQKVNQGIANLVNINIKGTLKNPKTSVGVAVDQVATDIIDMVSKGDAAKNALSDFLGNAINPLKKQADKSKAANIPSSSPCALTGS